LLASPMRGARTIRRTQNSGGTFRGSWGIHPYLQKRTRIEHINQSQLEAAAAEARVPEIAEIRAVFEEMLPIVTSMTAEINP